MSLLPRGSQKSLINPFDRLTTRSLTWGAIVAAAVLAINVPLTVRNTRETEQNAGWLEHSHQVVNELSNLLLLVNDAETRARAFVVTRDSLDFVQIADVRTALEQRVRVLDTLVVDNTLQRGRLEHRGICQRTPGRIESIAGDRRPAGLRRRAARNGGAGGESSQ